MNYQNVILHLSLISGIGPSAVIKIVDLIGLENIQNLYQLSMLDFVNLGISEKKSEILVCHEFSFLQILLITKLCFYETRQIYLYLQ